MTLVNSPRSATCLFDKINTLFNYFISKDGLPNPRGSLSSGINSQTIYSSNRAAEAELGIMQKLTAKRKVHAPYIMIYVNYVTRVEIIQFKQKFKGNIFSYLQLTHKNNTLNNFYNQIISNNYFLNYGIAIQGNSLCLLYTG